MLDKIYELGPTNVSKQITDPKKMNMVNVSHWGAIIKNPRDFSNFAQNHKVISQVFSTLNYKDPTIHIEIPQPSE